jgi:hypothetical protein
VGDGALRGEVAESENELEGAVDALSSGEVRQPDKLSGIALRSQSMRRTRCPRSASPAARLSAVVVLPTPPFWFTTENARATRKPLEWSLIRVK